MIAETKAKLYIPLADIVDTDAEKKRLSAERENLLSCIARCNAKLSNSEFTSRAPAAVVDGEKKRLAGYEEKLAAVEELIKKYEYYKQCPAEAGHCDRDFFNFSDLRR